VLLQPVTEAASKRAGTERESHAIVGMLKRNRIE
jgi:hypothetical protein